MQCDVWVASSVRLYLPSHHITFHNQGSDQLYVASHWDSFRSLPSQLSKLIFKQDHSQHMVHSFPSWWQVPGYNYNNII